MAHIVSLEDFALAIQSDVAEATDNLLFLDLAEGLVEEELGTQDPWPTIAKSTVLAAASRPVWNPEGLNDEIVGGVTKGRDAAEMGVYLTDDEIKRLRGWKADNLGTGKPTFQFPGTWPYPDPVERTADPVTG